MQTAYLTHWFLDDRYLDNSQNNTGSPPVAQKDAYLLRRMLGKVM